MKYLRTGMRILLALFFIAAGVNHFVHPDFYINIMPGYIPAHRAMVLVSGVTEIIAGTMLLSRKTAIFGAWGIIAMLVIFFAVHIHMIVQADRYASVPLWLLYARIPLQFLFILWAWWFTRKVPPIAEGANP